MKILLIYRTNEDETGKSMKVLKEALEKKGHSVRAVSRNEDLGLPSLTSSMDALKNFVINEDKKENYDIVYTQDWSIAFPLVFPSKVLFDKHYCLFHGTEEKGAQSRIMQKIAGNLMGEHLFVKTEELKKKFSKAIFSKEGLDFLYRTK